MWIWFRRHLFMCTRACIERAGILYWTDFYDSLQTHHRQPLSPSIDFSMCCPFYDLSAAVLQPRHPNCISIDAALPVIILPYRMSSDFFSLHFAPVVLLIILWLGLIFGFDLHESHSPFRVHLSRILCTKRMCIVYTSENNMCALHLYAVRDHHSHNSSHIITISRDYKLWAEQLIDEPECAGPSEKTQRWLPKYKQNKGHRNCGINMSRFRSKNVF